MLAVASTAAPTPDWGAVASGAASTATASNTPQLVTGAVATAGAGITAAGIAAGAAWVPIVGPIIAGVTLALGLIFARKGPGQKIASTKIVDELEPQLKQNVEGYLAGPRTKASQQQALANFDAAWAYLTSASACGSESLGEPGRRCITDRARGGKWDWFSYYRDPIAADTPAEDVPGLPGVALPARGSLAAWLIPAGLLGLALWME